jgi:hypothetical protein
VLLVVGDVPLAATFATLVDEPEASYAVALLLEHPSDGRGVRLSLEPAAEDPHRLRWPDAVEFLRWYESPEPRLVLGAGLRRYAWERVGS